LDGVKLPKGSTSKRKRGKYMDWIKRCKSLYKDNKPPETKRRYTTTVKHEYLVRKGHRFERKTGQKNRKRDGRTDDVMYTGRAISSKTTPQEKSPPGRIFPFKLFFVQKSL
jgi:hypothetical protein